MKFNTFVPPMLLSEQDSPFDDEDFIFELKFDGIRATLHASPQGVRVFSRRGNEITEQYPELQKIKSLVEGEVIFDGELTSFEGGVPSFSKLQKRNLLKDKAKIVTLAEEEPVVFVAFDCLYDEDDLTEFPLLERKKVLEKYSDTDEFVKTKYVSTNGKKLFAKVKKMGLEGIVAKRKDSIYTPDYRTKDWIKIKNFKREVFTIGGYVENKDKASLLLGEKRDKKFYFVGKVSMMRSTPLYEKLVSSKDTRKSPFVDYVVEGAKYVPLKYSCEVVYIERTPSGHLRQPVFAREKVRK